jgi:hypothetical protein
MHQRAGARPWGKQGTLGALIVSIIKGICFLRYA